VLFRSQPLEIVRSKIASHGTGLATKTQIVAISSELVSGNERQIAACRRNIHSPSHYAGWAVAVFGRLGAWQAEWPFLDWTFRRCCWRLVVCLGLVLSRRSHPIFDPAHALDAPTKFVVTTREVQLEALSSREAPMMASRR
jgi:hypothetical protein